MKVAKAQPRLGKPRRLQALASPKGTEINWECVSPMLRGLLPHDLEYVYVIGEQPDGPVARHRNPEPEDEDYFLVTAQVMTGLGYEVRQGDVLRFLAKNGPGYVERKLRA